MSKQRGPRDNKAVQNYYGPTGAGHGSLIIPPSDRHQEIAEICGNLGLDLSPRQVQLVEEAIMTEYENRTEGCSNRQVHEVVKIGRNLDKKRRKEADSLGSPVPLRAIN